MTASVNPDNQETIPMDGLWDDSLREEPFKPSQVPSGSRIPSTPQSPEDFQLPAGDDAGGAETAKGGPGVPSAEVGGQVEGAEEENPTDDEVVEPPPLDTQPPPLDTQPAHETPEEESQDMLPPPSPGPEVIPSDEDVAGAASSASGGMKARLHHVRRSLYILDKISYRWYKTW